MQAKRINAGLSVSQKVAPERGRIVRAEFGHGGKPSPGFPARLIHGTQPSRLARLPAERMLPPIDRHAMPRGRAGMARPRMAA